MEAERWNKHMYIGCVHTGCNGTMVSLCNAHTHREEQEGGTGMCIRGIAVKQSITRICTVYCFPKSITHQM